MRGLDAPRARAMGEKARARVKSFGLDAMAERLLALYRELLGRR
jgi:hypothetical protein